MERDTGGHFTFTVSVKSTEKKCIVYRYWKDSSLNAHRGRHPLYTIIKYSVNGMKTWMIIMICGSEYHTSIGKYDIKKSKL